MSQSFLLFFMRIAVLIVIITSTWVYFWENDVIFSESLNQDSEQGK